MIPISSDQTLDIPDKKTGIIFKFRYITGSEHQARFLDLMESETETYTKISKGLPKIENEKPKDRKDRFIKALIEYRAKNNRETLKLYEAYIDLFLCGWESQGNKKIAAFPEDGHPSQMFSYQDKRDLHTMIQERISELAGLNGEEVKN